MVIEHAGPWHMVNVSVMFFKHLDATFVLLIGAQSSWKTLLPSRNVPWDDADHSEWLVVIRMDLAFIRLIVLITFQEMHRQPVQSKENLHCKIIYVDVSITLTKPSSDVFTKT